MGLLFNARDLTHSFGARTLFRSLSFSVNDGERVALIGPNGAGKSTLMSLIQGSLAPDQGEVVRKSALKVGFLRQNPELDPESEILPAIVGLRPGEGIEDVEWERLANAEKWISRLELDPFVKQGTRVGELSGGWRKRIALARELSSEPDLLLLDEPTNHLDIESILWLENFLARVPFATLTVTHDLAFLQATSNRILELNPRFEGGLLSVNGDYGQYLETRASVLSAQERNEQVLENTLRRETEWIRRGAKARTTKQQARIKRHGELEDKLSEVSERNKKKTLDLGFQSSENSPKKLIEASEISLSYGGLKLFEKLSLRASPGLRLGIIGRNGSGKSSFLRVLLGSETPTSGRVTTADNLLVAYFDQNRTLLDLDATPTSYLAPKSEWVDFQGRKLHVRSYLERFLFASNQMELPIRQLSGGERARLSLAALMLEPCQVLVLDEPTNDLDRETLTVLQECLDSFEGALFLVSHDRYFLEQVCDRFLAFSPKNPGKTEWFSSIEQWEEWRALEVSTNAAANKEAAKSGDGKTPAAPKKLSYKDQREYEQMESKILTLESEVEQLSAELHNPATQKELKRLTELTDQLSKKQRELDHSYSRWAELEALVKGTAGAKT